MHLLHAGVASTEENEFESRKSEWPTEVRIGSSPIAHLFYFFCYVKPLGFSINKESRRFACGYVNYDMIYL